MARVRSVDFLPEIFQTDANKQFLAATLDQLMQEPKFKKTQGYIGRTVGPGVNPNDKYVVEPSKVRNDYQLEPGVISLDPAETTTIQDAITYPGINDALQFQGADVTNPQRLYTSEYYTWDPFVDFDAFINFNQYFWVPDGPDVVSVYADAVPLSQNFVVTRANGVYTFSGANGNNPTLDLVRGGNYTFQVSNNNKETVNFRVQIQTGTGGARAYVIDSQPNPTLTLARGNTYVFTLNGTAEFPFWIKTQPITGTGSAYSSGVTNNGGVIGVVTFVVPQDAPDTLYYSAQNNTNLHGQINIVDSASGTGPGFWIQTAPGVNGQNPTSPNLSTRSVLGVVNNGEDLGTVGFAVPSKTAQQFYYNLTDIGGVDLLTDLEFADIDGANVLDFIATYGGIDGVTNLDTRTLVFNSAIVPRAIWRISYVGSGSGTTMLLTEIQTIPSLNRFTITFGAEYSNTQWFVNNSTYFEQIPLLSAVQDVLYYQDGTDPEIFGRIRLLEQANTSDIRIADILGKKNYTSPNGVVFTNGLKVKFTGNVIPSSYQSGSTAITCSSTVAGINLITCDTTQQLIKGQTIVFSGTVIGGLQPDTTYYVRSIFSGTQFSVSAVPNGPSVTLIGASGIMTALATALNEYYVAGVGAAIELLPVSNFVVPETYATDANTATVFIEPSALDYITISRASKDLNAWTRSNRWFHIDVLNATGEYNNTSVVLDNNFRGKRPILQFRPGIRLFDMGTEGKQSVNAIDFTETDALSNVEGATSYITASGYTLVNGSRIVFGADTDPDVRDKIYIVNFITPDTVPPLIAQPIINLIVADDGEVLANQSTVCLSGTQIGITYWYDGVDWIEAQQKTSIQQAPLFNVYNANGYSFSDRSVYPSSTFAGSKLFSYAPGFGYIDTVLLFKLQYLSLSNVGDIVFDNNLYTDTFDYVSDNVGQTINISQGYPWEYATRTDYVRLLGWQTGVTPALVRQQFKFTYDTQPILLDIAALTDQQTIVPAIKVFVGAQFQSPDTYSVVTTASTTTITFLIDHVIGDVVEIAVLSNQTSPTAFYQVPSNLSQNPLNGNSPNFSLGTARTHYETICQNLTDLVGAINGQNNTRDLGNIIPYGQLILQQSSPLTLAGYFMRSAKYNIFASMEYNSREYQKYKNQILEAVTRQTINFNQTDSQVLDLVIGDVIVGRTESNPFYWSDMLPGTQMFTTTNYTVSVTTTNQFNTIQVYNYKSANYLGMNVYLNDILLTRGLDYFVSTTASVLTLSTELFDTLVNGDVVSLQEYTETYGTFVPNTPTKLGLYPAWRPGIIEVKTSSSTALVIQGHDGSQTPLFDDIRDQVLLEFETRIYNNLKLDDNPIPLTIADVLPGQFRTTDYTYTEINDILSESFLTYVGWNKLDYTTQDYNAGNPFTFNYTQSNNILTNQPLAIGAWRGINRYFYDTQQPEQAPWEMLGFTERPLWWEITYGPAPYTRDNQVLWDDLELGLVRDPVVPYILPKYARPGLTQVLPTNSEGALLAPLYSVVGVYPANSFQQSWAVGDGAPVEASWWNSSDYPFAVMRLLSLTRPAEFFALFADRDLYRYQLEFDQYLYNDRYRLDANGVQVYGDGVSKASYIDWIVDYNKLFGTNSTQALQNDLANLDVRLCYRMASFSDKQYMKIYTEKSSPASTNASLMIPDESYDLLLYKNQPFDRSSYSSVVIQVVENGWAVYGYSTTRPFFNILTSIPAGQFRTFTVGPTTVTVPANYSQDITQVPYGFVFTTEAAVSNFLLSYGQLLEQQGFIYDDFTNGYVMDWNQMVSEFLYWSNQGWGLNTLINLNPVASKLSVFKEQAVVDTLSAQTSEHVLLDQNRREFPIRDLNIVRLDNTFTIEPLTPLSLSYIEMRYTSFESMVVLNNASLFGDLIYYPITGARQNRLYLTAATSTEWNGSVDAQGFILNQNNIETWTGLKIYPKGTIVKYKGSYWSAATIVQPSTKFNYNDWNQSDYTLIQQGLLPNLANKADQLANSYDINSANLESDNDLLSYGLIGFRPRQYLAALNLDDVSQLNVYRQFLGTKGTILAADLLANAQLNKERAEYTIYENWAVQRSVYGANANRRFIDLRLNRALLTSDPVLVQIIQPQQQSEADQTVLLSEVWKSSFALTTTNVFPTTTTTVTDIGLPTAGYVNLNDADITVFQLSDPASLSANLNTIQNGTSIWVAKVNDYDWNIYRAQFIPGQIQHVCDNLNGTARVIFSGQHGLAVGDTLIIRFFDSEVNGVYKVLSVSDLNTVNIAFSFDSGRTVADGHGIGFKLQTMRVAQASDVINLPYAKQIIPGQKVWVDNNGDGLWEVLEKTNPFTVQSKLEPTGIGVEPNGMYGTSLAQAQRQAALFVGNPGVVQNGNPVGAVHTYLRGTNSQYIPLSLVENTNTLLLLNSPGTREFGSSLAFGNQTWGISGAPGSYNGIGVANSGYCGVIQKSIVGPTPTNPNPYAIVQVLTIPDIAELITGGAEFGYSVTISNNERWIYVGAPEINTVYAYGRVDWINQVVNVNVTEEIANVYIGDDIQINTPYQIVVYLNGRLLAYGFDYTVSPTLTQVTFLSTIPTAGDFVSIQRISNIQPVGDGVTTTYPVSSSLFTATNEYSFSVVVDGVIQRLNVDYDYSTGNLIFFSPPDAGASISITAQTYFEYVAALTVSGLDPTDRFGHSVVCNSNGEQVIIGCKNATVTSLDQAGSVYVFNRNVQKFIRQDDSSNVYNVIGSPVEPVEVVVNNQYLLNADAATPSDTNTFSVSGSNVTINATLNVGDVIEISTNQFVLQQIVTQNTVAEFSNFGQAVDLCPYDCSLYTGAPQSSISAFKGGVVQRNVAQDRVYGTTTATVANPSFTPNTTLRVNNVDCSVTNMYTAVTSLQELANNINFLAPNAIASVDTNGYLTISVNNTKSALPGNKLQVDPGSVGDVYNELGFVAFIYTQTIESPLPKDYAAFGAALAIDDTANNLVVGAPLGTLYLPTTFDYNTVTKVPSTTFDGNSTTFFSPLTQSGAVYTFDYLPSSSDSVANPGIFVFGQQISNTQIKPFDNYGSAVVYNSGILVAGAPFNDFSDSVLDTGAAWIFQNPTQTPAWVVTYLQQPVVDIYALNSIFMYDRITSARTEFFDFFDPLQGKILGAAQQNLDYTGAVDPAFYNVGAFNNIGNTWTASHVGEMWWDTSTVRFIDPNQDNIVYSARRWGQIFPGSSVDVYQWIESTNPPASYVGTGTPRNLNSYVINTRLTQDGTFSTTYYFWVKNVIETYTQQGKTLNANIVAQYIANPRASGIGYIAPINSSTIAIYNGLEYINAFDTVISVEFDKELTTANVHAEYELIAQGRPDAFLSDPLYRKMQDSFCGVDSFGNLVPSPNLPVSQRYGIQIRPRQSMFVDRFAALKNYITRANSVFALYPISETRSFALLNSQEPEPLQTVVVDSVTITNWDLRVANLEILSFQNIYAVDLGYKYLVVSDSNNRGLWTIYTVELVPQLRNPVTAGNFTIGKWYEIATVGNTDWAAIGALSSVVGTLFQATGKGSGTGTAIPSDRQLMLLRVQNYKTSNYWSYIDWYLPGYNSSTKIYYEVSNYASLASLTVPVGTSVRVIANQQGKFEIYLLTAVGWERVGVQDGTIEISATIYDYQLGRYGFDAEVFDAQYYDEYPATETRRIIQAINDQLFIDELLIERNRALTLMFDFILSEQEAPEWLVKTSLIDVNHKIRQLLPFQNYIRDNQDFVSEYLQEVKPYHVQVREFNLSYNGLDDYLGDVTDFDLPAYYDTTLDIPQYVSPILTNDLAYTHATAQSFNTKSDTPATSVIWSDWPYSQWYNNYLLSVDSITVINQGTGYGEAPTVTIVGDATTPATAIAVINSLGNVVEIVVTNPGSGYQTTPTVEFSSQSGTGVTAYPIMTNALVRSFKTVIKYDRNQFVSTVLTWSPDGTYLPGTLVRYDNSVWEATPSDSSQVVGPTFDYENWTVVPADELSGVDRTMGYYTPNVNEPGLQLSLLIDGVDYPGVQVYGRDFNYIDPLDTIYASSFTDQYLGLRPTDINVDGGKFIGLYEGHAPEELVNGSEYDTLDLRVYTRPGSDWELNGHGFDFNSIRYTVARGTDSYSWAQVVQRPAQVLVSNVTTGVDLILDVDFTIDWVNKTVVIINDAIIGNVINITAYEVGGGSQLYRGYYTGAQAGSSIIIPVASSEISQAVVFVDGQSVTGQYWQPYAPYLDWFITTAYPFQSVVKLNNVYYRAQQNVPVGTPIENTNYWLAFVPSYASTLYFGTTYAADSGIAIVILGNPNEYVDQEPYDSTTFDEGDNTGFPGSFDFGTQTNPDSYSWSTPQVQYIQFDDSSASSQTLTLTNSIEGTNPANLIVTRNGLRLLPPAGIEWHGDDSSTSFGLPQRLGNSFTQESLSDSDITVWIDSVLQTLGVDYTITAWTGSNTPGRQVVFTFVPASGTTILISVVGYGNDYTVIPGDPNTIQLVNLPTPGDIFAVTTWNDTQQQDICTLVFVGPVSNGGEITVSQPFDSTLFSTGTVNFASGSFDFSEGQVIPANNFYLDRPGITANRLWVTLNGYRLFDGIDFTVQDDYLILASGTISTAQTLVVTEFTENTVPDAIAFRIFQDMRGVQVTYRITDSTTTILAEPVTSTDDIIYVEDVGHLSEPNLDAGIFGVATINGERIMYRVRDFANNSISSLLRGTAGTAAADHAVGAFVYDMGRGNLMPVDQNYVETGSSLADGITSSFIAADISYGSLLGEDSTVDTRCVEVFVGGVQQFDNFVVDPSATYPEENNYDVLGYSDTPYSSTDFIGTMITLDFVPPAGVEVTILVRRGTWWYDLSTAYTRTLPLQQTNTRAARFLRGL